MRRLVIPYESIQNDLRTGDLFLARGQRWLSLVIRVLTLSPWTHCGMIVLPRDLGLEDRLESDEPHLWESMNSSTVPCKLTRKNLGPESERRLGPMLVPLRSRIAKSVSFGHYDRFAVRHLRRELDPDLRARLRTVVCDPYFAQCSFPGYAEMFREAYGERWFGRNEAGPFDRLYCSHLLALTFQRMGLIPDLPYPESYIAADFSSEGCLPLLRRVEYGREIFVTVKGVDRRRPLIATLLRHG